MNNNRLITPLFALRNTYPSKLKSEFGPYYNLDLSLNYISYIICLRDLSITKCLFNLMSAADQRIYEEICLFQKHERAAFIGYSNLPAIIMESKELDILQFSGEEMTDEKFIDRIIEWGGKK